MLREINPMLTFTDGWLLVLVIFDDHHFGIQMP
jgi:hypothetical protein